MTQIREFTAKATPEDTDAVVIQDANNVTKYVLIGNMHKAKVGFFDYNDLATATTPITHNGAEGYKQLTNDGAGAFTQLGYAPTGMTTLWNTVTNQLDFSELSLGDMIDLRVDVDVTTTTPNQEVSIRLDVAIGTVGNFQLELDRRTFKSAGTYKLIRYIGGYIGNAFTNDNPAEIQLDSDAACTVLVDGWYCKVTRR